MLSKLGMNPVKNVASPINNKENTKTFFRPILSPICPANIPPTGRAKKPTP